MLIFMVFGLIRPGVEPRSTFSVADVLSICPMVVQRKCFTTILVGEPVEKGDYFHTIQIVDTPTPHRRPPILGTSWLPLTARQMDGFNILVRIKHERVEIALLRKMKLLL